MTFASNIILYDLCDFISINYNSVDIIVGRDSRELDKISVGIIAERK